MANPVGVAVVRFQVPELHKGHSNILKIVRAEHERVILFVGVSPIRCDKSDPLDFNIRRQMILEEYEDIEIYPIADVGDNNKWSINLDSQISLLIGETTPAVLYGGRKSFLDKYKGKYKQYKCEEVPNISGTEIREKIYNKPINSYNFRAGIIYCTGNQFINATPCVDAALFNKDETKILLGRKKDEEKFRFIGGHVDPGETYEEAVLREIREEVNVDAECQEYLGSFVSDDWRHRNKESKITTILFKTKLICGTSEAKDDIVEVRWFDITTIKVRSVFVKTHIPMANKLFDYLKKGGKM